MHRQQQHNYQVTSQSPVLGTPLRAVVCTFHTWHHAHRAQVLPEAEWQKAPVAGLLVWLRQLACPVKEAVMLLGHIVLLRTPQISCIHCNQAHLG